MNVVIIEDEAPAARAIQRLLNELNMSINVLAVMGSVEQSLQWFADNKDVDLILSDIQLSDDISFTLFDQLNLDIPVIFITAYDQYAIRAFQHFSIDYLIKPITILALKDSIDKYLRLKEKYSKPDFKLLLNEIRDKNYSKRFLVYSGQDMLSINIEQIAYFFYEDSVSILVTKNNKQYIMYESLDSIFKNLDPEKFFRINRQYIVAFDSIVSAQNYFKGKIKIMLKQNTGKEVLVSKDKASEFKKWMNM